MTFAGFKSTGAQSGAARQLGTACLMTLGLGLAGCAQTSTDPAARVGGCAAGNPVYVGHYYLGGVREVGSEILLRPDGSFEFMLAYGANDQYGRGCWKLDGMTLALVPEGRTAASRMHSPEHRGFKGLVLQVSGRDLVWDIAGTGHRGRYEKGSA